MKHTLSKISGIAAIALLTLNSGSLFAQTEDTKPTCKPHDFNIGVRGAANATMLYAGEKQINKDYGFDGGYTVGLTGSYAINDLLSIVAEADYSKLNTKRDGLQPVLPTATLYSATSDLYASFTKKEMFNYVEVPVMARISTGKAMKFFANAGPYVGFLTAASVRTSGNSVLYKDAKGQVPEGSNTIYNFSANEDMTSHFTTVNFGVAGGLGVSYTYEKHSFNVEGRYNIGLTNIRNTSDLYGKNNLQTFALGLGYSYLLFR